MAGEGRERGRWEGEGWSGSMGGWEDEGVGGGGGVGMGGWQGIEIEGRGGWADFLCRQREAGGNQQYGKWRRGWLGGDGRR